jgi:hypothetical protein
MSSKRKRIKKKRKSHKKGLDYLQNAGLNLIITSNKGDRLVFEPGSAFEDIKKETLSEPYIVTKMFGQKYTLDQRLIKRYKIRTQVDLYRMMRICSIVITSFTGPDDQDDSNNHLIRLREWIKENCYEDGIWDIYLALTSLDKFLGYKKSFEFSVYSDFAHILNDFLRLWKDDPLKNPYEGIDPLDVDLS